MAGVVVTPTAADACGRKSKFRGERTSPRQQKKRDLRRAEHFLAQGKHSKAVRVLAKRFNKTRVLPKTVKISPLFDRAQRVLALAAVRSDGAIKLGKGLNGKSEFDKQVNVAWGVSVLQFHVARDPENIVLRTEYAEALSHMPGLETYAYKLLKQLHDDDLMPTARGYALLANLQHDMGEQAEGQASLQRCRQLGETDGCALS